MASSQAHFAYGFMKRACNGYEDGFGLASQLTRNREFRMSDIGMLEYCSQSDGTHGKADKRQELPFLAFFETQKAFRMGSALLHCQAVFWAESLACVQIILQIMTSCQQKNTCHRQKTIKSKCGKSNTCFWN